MFALLRLIPGVATAIQAITTAIFNAKVQMVQARIGGDRDVAVTMVKAAAVQEHENSSKLAVMASNMVLTFMLVAFALPLIVFEWKVIVWDIVLGLGSTDPIRGQVAEWANTIIAFLFGSSTVVAVGKMWFSRDKSGQ